MQFNLLKGTIWGLKPVCNKNTFRSLLVFTSAIIFLYLVPFFITHTLGTFSMEKPSQDFITDINFAFIAVICIPSIILILININLIINNNINKLVENNSLEIKLSDNQISTFNKKTKAYNIITTIISLVIAFINGGVTIFNTIFGSSITWYGLLENPNTLSFIGIYSAITVIALFAYLLAQLFFIELRVILFLRLLVKNSDVKVLPLHPDKLGGLRPISKIGFTFQIAIAIIGINIGVYLYNIIFLFEMNTYTIMILILTAILYIIISPLAFIAPLYLFRREILKTKNKLLSDISRKHNYLFEEIIKSNKDELSALETLEYHKYMHSEISKLPEWPFDFGTLRKFSTVFFAPVYSILLAFLIEKAISLFIA